MLQSLQQTDDVTEYEIALDDLSAAKETWARVSTDERVSLLLVIKDRLKASAKQWAVLSAEKKRIPDGSPLIGEEWISGPYALMTACNFYIETLREMSGKKFLEKLPMRTNACDQLEVRVAPHSIWERLLLSGVSANLWLKPGVTQSKLRSQVATVYDIPERDRTGKVALVLGAGNISSIAPLDCFQKLFSENQVVILKLNPVNDYLLDILTDILEPLINRNALRIVCGDGSVGKALCNSPLVDEIHITGAEQTHDAIVWGVGEVGQRNKAAGTPENHRPITSELGGVSPTIVVPGPWSEADIKFQAQHIATQKLHNSGFNCIACQMLILPSEWALRDRLLSATFDAMRDAPQRGMYYPGAQERLRTFKENAETCHSIPRTDGEAIALAEFSVNPPEWFRTTESFCPALSIMNKSCDAGAEAYLEAVIEYANENLRGTLGANIIIHPQTKREIGRRRFEEIVGKLRYGTIGINAWTGLGFLMPQAAWGAFPGHSLANVESGIGTVHNSFMFECVERSVIEAPFRPFPRSFTKGEWSILPKPPWFVSNKRQHIIGERLTDFQHQPGWHKLPAIFLNALYG